MDTDVRIQELEEQIRYHSDLYFNQAQPEITDAEFDALVAELRTLDPDNAVLGEVGSVPSYGQKVTHSRLMGSLDKVNEADGVTEWAGKYTQDTSTTPVITVTPKMDGLAVRLNYEGGKLIEAATRGNGEVGQNITDNVLAMKSIPNTVANQLTAEVRGEVFMPRSVFDVLNDRLRAAGDKPFANPRNAAAGSATCQDPAVTGSRSLDFRWYDVVCDEEFETEKERRAWGAVNLDGLTPVDMEVIPVDRFAAVALEWEAKRPNLDFEIDGLVTALLLTEDQEEAGMAGRCPRGKLAFKFKPEQKTAIDRDIDAQVGRTGRLTPVARIEPTYIAGSTVSNLTLHNYGRVKELGIMPGDEILFEKAGDIIPQVIRVTDRHGRDESECWPVPTNCPSCDGPVRLDDKGVNLWCDNPACPAKLEARVEHWIKRLEILGIGPAAIHDLCSSGLVTDIADLYYLTGQKVAMVIAGNTMPGRIVELILEKNEIPLWQFLAALGIHNLGRTTSKLMAKEFKTLDAIMKLLEMNDPSPILQAMDGVGDTVAENILSGLEAMRETITRVTECIDVLEVEDASGPLAGKTFCLTGALPSGTKRADMAKQIEAAGGEVKSGVGKGLGYLVQADVNSTSSKSIKAQKLGTEIIDEDILISMMGA